jgi:type II secretory pathway pseudopilin PulG
MSPLRLRFTVREMLIATAIIALLMGAGRLLWLSSVYRKAALAHAAAENLARTLQSAVENEGDAVRELQVAFDVQVEPDSEADKARRAAAVRVNQKTAEYHAALKHKYERAAAHPWMPIDPDPHPPEPDVIPNPAEVEQKASDMTNGKAGNLTDG